MTEREALENAIEILVVLQYGTSQYLSNLDCSRCTRADKKEYGCALGSRRITYMKTPVYIKHLDKEYANCPISLIPNIIYQLLDKYNRMKELNQSMDDRDTPAIYWWFVKTYNRIKSDIDRKRHEESLSKSKNHKT